MTTLYIKYSKTCTGYHKGEDITTYNKVYLDIDKKHKDDESYITHKIGSMQDPRLNYRIKILSMEEVCLD